MNFYYNGYKWSLNKTAHRVFNDNSGNCGGCSNLMNYILQGDYDSQGYMGESANTGGHVYNYFKVDGIYYFIDFLSIIRNGKYDNPSYDIYATTDPKEYSRYYIEKKNRDDSPSDPKYLVLHHMYELDGNHLLKASDENVTTICGTPYANIFPEEYKDIIIFLYIDEKYPQPKFVKSPPQSKWPKEAR